MAFNLALNLPRLPLKKKKKKKKKIILEKKKFEQYIRQEFELLFFQILTN